MRQAPPTRARELPGWLILLGSVVLILHLGALGALVLAAPSGPWVMSLGQSMATGPYFAEQINNVATPEYLQRLKLSHNYHFITNRPGGPGVEFDAVLLDESGKEIQRLTFPEKSAPCWVRHRQAMLARALGDDVPEQPPQGEMVAPPGKEVPMVQIWEMAGGKELQLRTYAKHLLPRDRPLERPSEWSLLLARSYGRYLCREHNAASVKIYRRSREPISPVILLAGDAMPGTFDERVAFFGEFTR